MKYPITAAAAPITADNPHTKTFLFHPCRFYLSANQLVKKYPPTAPTIPPITAPITLAAMYPLSSALLIGLFSQ